MESVREKGHVRWTKKECTGWGRTSSAQVSVVEPRSVSSLCQAIKVGEPESLLALGGGRSYGDNAINSCGAGIATSFLKKIESFDSTSEELVCESGVTYLQLMEKFLSQGLVVPVSPGTAFATIGGAIANDVHGKNHDQVGSIGDHVKWMDLVLSDGSITRVSPSKNRELFDATIGGIGLTGVIARVCFNMSRIDCDSVVVTEQKVRSLEEFMEKLSASRVESTYSVGWIDALQRGQRLGRGILETAIQSGEYLRKPPRRSIRVPFNFPSGTLNRHTVRLFNAAYFNRIPAGGRKRLESYDRFTYPLDAIRDWNRIYGSSGFFQFQCVLPDEQSRRGLRLLLETVSEAGCASFLAVLKTLGSSGRGLLSFPKRGFTLALDIPHRSGSRDVISKLEAITLDHGGRTYLAKDATLSRDNFRQMYPDCTRLEALLEKIDPKRRFDSDMAKRLGIRHDDS